MPTLCQESGNPIEYSSTTTPPRSRAKAGSGMLYLRGSTWWIKYHQDGRPFYESTPGPKTNGRRARFCATDS
jgi:hypothetical protein